MKKIALLSILLLFACASSDDMTAGRAVDCAPGADLEIRAGIDRGTSALAERTNDLTFLVEVANNSHHDVTVTSIYIQPRTYEAGRSSGIDSVSKTFDQLVEQGDDHVFRLPVDASVALASPFDDQVSRRVPYEFVVTVALSNGDRYRCPFAVERL